METNKKPRRGIIGVFICLFTLLLFVLPGKPIPPKYSSIKRNQLQDYTFQESDIMRIWVVYVGQGDGILIQLPSKYNYASPFDENSDFRNERIDILLDGGSFNKADETRMQTFLHALYPQPRITVEHAVISHHDSDHITGLTRILRDPTISVKHIYHNGLASYRPSAISGTSQYGLIKSNERTMARLKEDRLTLNEEDLIKDLSVLRQRQNSHKFQGLYDDLAGAICEKTEPKEVYEFSRVWEGEEFIKEREAAAERNLADFTFSVLWPLKNLNSYNKDWGETINGNSLTFLLKYGDFEMLFTGDQNEYSEELFLRHLKSEGKEQLMNCDVLKVPHHGSAHNIQTFFIPIKTQGAISVASLGAQGFNSNWHHPSTDVIEWAGGAHRFYSTYIHERKFKWSDLSDNTKRNEMLELKHILIETDGDWFRLVEVDVDSTDLNNPPYGDTDTQGKWNMLD